MRSDVPTTTPDVTARSDAIVSQSLTALIALEAILVGTGIVAALVTVGITVWWAVTIGLFYAITDFTLTRACTAAASAPPPRRRRLPIYLTAGLFAAVTALIIGPVLTMAVYTSEIDNALHDTQINAATDELDEATSIRDSRYADWQRELRGIGGTGVAGNGDEARRLLHLYGQANRTVADQQQALDQARLQTPSPSLPDRYTTLSTLPYASITMALITAIIFVLGIAPVFLAVTRAHTSTNTQGAP